MVGVEGAGGEASDVALRFLGGLTGAGEGGGGIVADAVVSPWLLSRDERLVAAMVALVVLKSSWRPMTVCELLTVGG